jgi:DNA-binding transcriptional LysR family regulator
MSQKIAWDQRVGRRLKLRNLHIFMSAAREGSMAQAAKLLGVSQPTISDAVADLESTFGVKLLDRSPRGVALTIFGQALMRRSVAAFDELEQSTLDPGYGELRIGYQESLSPAIVAPLVAAFSRQHPGVVLHMDNLPSTALQLSELRARHYDFTLTLLPKSFVDEDDIAVEILLHDQLAIAASADSRWARRRRIELAELAGASWVLAPPDTWNTNELFNAFRAIGLDMPRATLITMSEPLRTLILKGGDYVSAFASSTLRANAERFGLKVLPVALPAHPWPIALLRLKNRTLSPAGERLMAHARLVARDLIKDSPGG